MYRFYKINLRVRLENKINLGEKIRNLSPKEKKTFKQEKLSK